MSLEANDTKIKPRFTILGILLGLAIIELQLPGLSSISCRSEDIRACVLPMFLAGMGIAISLGSYLSMMKTRYGRWCILPPEWEDSLRSKHESWLIKCLIILFIIQCVLGVFVVMYVFSRAFEDLGFYAISLYAGILLILYLVLLGCGYKVFSCIYENRKNGLC